MHSCPEIGFSMWRPLNLCVKLSWLAPTGSQQQNGAPSFNGQVRKGLAWAVASHECEREFCCWEGRTQHSLEWEHLWEPFVRKPVAQLVYYFLLLLYHAMERCNGPFNISLQIQGKAPWSIVPRASEQVNISRQGWLNYRPTKVSWTPVNYCLSSVPRIFPLVEEGPASSYTAQ